MTDDRNQTRPVRTLTVKNFSVIKEAKLEFGKIAVLIGPQSSGKSLVCKLAYFLGAEIVATAVESLINRNSWEEFLQAAVRDFHSRFSIKGWLKTSSTALFTSQQFSVEVRGTGDPLNPVVEFAFCEEFRDLYVRMSNNPLEQPSQSSISRSELRQELWVRLSLLLDKKRTQASVYIPSGRSFFTDIGKSVSALQNPDLDQITKRFAGQIAWDTRWKVGLLTTGRGVVQEIEREFYRIVGGAVIVADGTPLFLSADGRSLPLSLQSSGTQELLPMFSVLNYLAFQQEHLYARAASTKISHLAEIVNHNWRVYLEEPESNVFPNTQRELIQLFAWLANDPILSFDWVITTHSPYILTSFNNLIEAGQAARNNPKLHDEVAKIVPEKCWIKEGDFRAYAIEDGKLKSILNESGFIEGNYLDQVSEVIGDEFDRLLRLEYEHTNAS